MLFKFRTLYIQSSVILLSTFGMHCAVAQTPPTSVPMPLTAEHYSAQVPPALRSSSSLGKYDYGSKYAVSCVIYILERHYIEVVITALSTYKVNECDVQEFESTTSASIRAQLTTYSNIAFIFPKGAEFQMMDLNKSTLQNPYLSVGNLFFTPISKSELGLSDVLLNFKSWYNWRIRKIAYSPIETRENINYTWLPGGEIFLLTDLEGKKYALTHFSPKVPISDVAAVAVTLKRFMDAVSIPKGWKIEEYHLKKPLFVVRNAPTGGDLSTRLFDEFGNRYLLLHETVE